MNSSNDGRSSGFIRYELRTTEVEVARAFYARLLGHDRAIVWPLHEQARARGAVPHWLGSIGVEDLSRLDATRDELVRRGGMALGPTYSRADGHGAVLRDPGGAIVGLAAPPSPDTSVDVAWHVLNTNDLTAAIGNYRTLFGWNIADHAPHEFSWDDRGTITGVMAGVVGRPGVHPHWLFFFRVASFDDGVEWTRRAGGTAMDPIVVGRGVRISICEDPQHAAFGLIE
jgi:uncharacterized protein